MIVIGKVLSIILSLLFMFHSGSLYAQTLNMLKTGVVKIKAQTLGKQKIGTGFIVQLTKDKAYIVTASHVVSGDKHPQVEFFTQKNITVSTTVVGLESGELRGLAVLLVSGKENLPAGISALSLDPSAYVEGGDEVVVIGFPRLAGPWSVIKGDIVSRKGREIIFSGAVDEGNSGGPMIKEGKVVALVAGVVGPYGNAIPASSLRLFLAGWGIKLSKEVKAYSAKEPTSKTEVTQRPPLAATTKATRLRSKPDIVIHKEIEQVIKERGFNYPAHNMPGNFVHHYETKIINGIKAVLDHATGLMWQQSGSSRGMNWEEAKEFIEQLNGNHYAGFSDWRLPTIEELVSLVEPKKKKGNLYISPVFDTVKTGYWSADEGIRGVRLGLVYTREPTAWAVGFSDGSVANKRVDTYFYIRAVRTIQ